MFVPAGTVLQNVLKVPRTPPTDAVKGLRCARTLMGAEKCAAPSVEMFTQILLGP
jgi:hypothetical protein